MVVNAGSSNSRNKAADYSNSNSNNYLSEAVRVKIKAAATKKDEPTSKRPQLYIFIQLIIS